MRPVDILCRLCRHPYSITDEGCEVCKPAKSNIMWPSLDPDEELTALNSSREALRYTRQRLRDLKKSQDESIGGRTGQLDAKELRAFNELVRTQAQLVEVVRKIEKDEAAQTRSLTFEERVRAIAQLVEQWPEEHQKVLLETLSEALSEHRMLNPGYTEAEVVTE